MAESLNTVALVGRLGQDPEVRQTQGGTSVCNLSLAVDGRGEDVTHWIDVTLWGKSAEAAGQHLSKGRRIGVQGRLEQERWTDKATGASRSRLKVVAERFQFLDSRQDGEAGGRSNDLPPAAGGSPSAPGDDDSIPFAASWV